MNVLYQLHHVGSLNSQNIAPVTYMWKLLQSNFVSKVDNMDKSEEQQRVDSCALLRKIWLWIHPAAFREGYRVLESICERVRRTCCNNQFWYLRVMVNIRMSLHFVA